MEAPDSPHLVALPLFALHQSRLGPEVEVEEGVFHAATLGKYKHHCFTSSPDCSTSFSSSYCQTLAPVTLPSSSMQRRTPGRTVYNIMEAPNSSDTVEPNAAIDHQRRPGPVVVTEEGVFQPVTPGKYLCRSNVVLPDASSISSEVESNSLPARSDRLLDDNSTESEAVASTEEHRDIVIRQVQSRLSSETTGSSTFSRYDERDSIRPKSGVHIYYQNVGGVNSNVNEYRLACSDSCYDVIAMTETWLKDHTLSNQVFGPCYDVFRCDRSHLNSRKSSGGGVLLAVRYGLKSRVISNDSWRCVEQVWIAIELVDRTLYLCVVYFPPDRVRDSQLIDAHTESISSITAMASPGDDIIVLGDFNIPGLKWCSSGNGFLHPDLVQSQLPNSIFTLLDNYSTATLRQINNCVNENDRMLDLCFSTAQDYAPTISVALSPLVKSVRHHPPLHLVLDNRTALEFNTISTAVNYNFKNADYNSIVFELARIDWDDILHQDDVDSAVESFTRILNCIMGRHVPLARKQDPGRQAWQTNALLKLKKVKRRALKKYSKSRTTLLKDRYLKLNHSYRKMSRSCYASYERKIQQRLKTNPKSFWRYVNEQRKECGLPTTMILHKNIASGSRDICQLFSAKFSSIFTDETLPHEHIASAANNVPLLNRSINDIFINDAKILAAVAKLKSSMSPGPDGIPSVLLKKCASALLAPLSSIFRMSLTSGVFPSLWKKAHVFPVHKKGDKRNIDNYRGISSLCAVSKLFELIVLEPIFFQTKQYISDDQHGFMPKRSTTTNLLTFTSYISDGFAKRLQTDAIYTDLSAAFDKINHSIAVAKLARLGFCGPLLNWFESYLTGRQLNVKIGDEQSDPFPAPSGVPQGSHLGPLIFLLYFNDINLSLKGPRLSFADDLKLYFHIKSEKDARFLQGQFSCVAWWCDLNRMILNPDKCSVVTFSRIRQPIVFEYTLHTTPIARDCEVKDLGVLLDAKLTYKQHTSYVVNKASRQLGFIFRVAKNFKDIYCLKSLYCSLVRSTIEYCSQIWNPYYQNGADRIESVQRRFIRFALRWLHWRDPLRLPAYENRCQLIQIDTLQIRRDVSRALLVADLLTSRIDCPAILAQIDLQARVRSMRNNSLLRIPFQRNNYNANGAITGLQRIFNRVSNRFDFNSSRLALRNNFLIALRHPST